MAANIDVRAIVSLSSLPEATVTSLLDAPTVDAVKALLKGIEASAKEFDQFKSQKVKLEVELETVVRTSESKAKVLSNSRDKALADASKLRVELQTSENTRSRLESELDQVRNATTSEAAEITTLKSRISALEAANRDTLALLESRTSAYDKLSQDLSSQHQKAVELRRQIYSLEQSNQAANSSVASSKYKEQSLQQEIDLLRKNNDWLENERKIKADEHTNFRKEKNARIAELSRSNEQYISEAETLRRSEASLKHRLEEQVARSEDLIQEIQKLREEIISEADSFRIDLESVNRLAELQKASADTAKERVQELSDALEETKEEAANEIGRIRAEAESEHVDKLAAERRITELEASNGQLQTELEQAHSRPVTPQQPIHGNGLSTPMRPGTPLGIFSPSSTSRLKGNLSTTQLYTEYKKLEKDLASEKRNNEELRNNMDAMLEDLESSKPEIDEMRAEHSRIQAELREMSNLVNRANDGRDEGVKEARSFQGQLAAQLKKVAEQEQELRDRASQIRYLLMEQIVRERGDSLSREDFQDLQNEADKAFREETANLSSAQQIVNEQFIIFKSIAEMQQQNQSQLKTIRNLVANLEEKESEERQQRQAALELELEAAKIQIAGFQDEIRTMVTQSRSFVKERDMFRNMLTRRGHLNGQVGPEDFSRSLPIPPVISPARGFDEGSIAGGESDYAKLLKDLQSHFDLYRQEAATDHSALKKQVEDLTKRSSQLQTEGSRIFGQLSAANQRCEMLQTNYNMLKTENSEIQKRSYAAMENATKQELRTQQTAEELVEARGLLDSLRRESANLKAEKDLWKSVENRLIEDNESLRNERGRLDQMNGSLQNILNEREQADSETRRRLQAQVEFLESELNSTKRKLNEEIEESKKATLRREYDHEQSQKRIDDLVTNLGSIREEHASARTSRDHLQARVDELTVELRSAEERLEVLTRPLPEPTGGSTDVEENSVSRGAELEVQVSELKRDLELKMSELERANEQVEVYKNISQSSEDRLQELTETNDQYREETEAAITAKDLKIKNLEERIEDMASELSTTNTELSQLRDIQSESNRKLDEQRVSFEAEIVRLKEQDEKNAEQAQFNLDATKAQANIATDAQQNYENELLKHAEAARALQTVRAEANQVRLEMLELRTSAETANTNLRQKESSWSEMKDRYEQELTDIKKRREEVLQQNTLLHGQLENVTQQITALQRDRAALAEGETTESSAPGLENLQEVIKYLRREKEIVDVQYHLSTQEAKRLRQQLDFAQSQLDKTHLKLDQQQRLEADSERNAMSHNKLMETLNELNLFRESSVTLRAEAKQALQALAEKTQRVEELESRIQPLQARIAELENLSELRDGEMKLLQADRDHWQQRTQNILSKYDRIDPAINEELKATISNLETQRDEAVASRDSLQIQVDGIAEQIESAKTDLKTRLGEQFKTRSRDLNAKIREKQAEVDTAVVEKASIQSELDIVREQLESAHNQASIAPAPQLNGEMEIDNTSNTKEQSSRLEAKVSTLESFVSQKEQEIASLKSAQDEKFKARETEMRGQLNKRLSEFKQEAQKAKETALEELRASLNSEHQQALEALRAQTVPVATGVQKPDEGEITEKPTNLAVTEIPNEELEQLTEAQARHLLAKHEFFGKMLRINIRKATEKAREAAREEFLKAQGTTGLAQFSEANHELEQKFAAEKEALLQEKEAEFASERDNLIKQHQEELAQEKQELIIKHQEALSTQKLEFSAQEAKKIAQQVANAEQMAEKKSQLKVNMADNRAKAANAKLDVVKTAAEETPDKAVSEVWSVAKDAKPAPAAQQAKPATGPTAPPPSSTPSAPAAATGTAPEPTSVPSDQGSSQQSVPNGTARPAQANAGTGPAALRSLSSSLPRGGSSGRARGAFQSQGSQQTAGQSQPAGRGTGIPRGAPRGGRGGGGRVEPNVSTNVMQAPARRSASAASPGGLNPNATQFTPGGKRAREESESSDSSKRIRGGGVGSTSSG